MLFIVHAGMSVRFVGTVGGNNHVTSAIPYSRIGTYAPAA